MHFKLDCRTIVNLRTTNHTARVDLFIIKEKLLFDVAPS
jgi:hypothetical protein